MRHLIFNLVLLAVILLLAVKSFVVGKADERLVVFRFGKVLGVYGPGLSVVIPFLDRVVRIRVDKIAGWRDLSEGELQARAAELARTRDPGM